MLTASSACSQSFDITAYKAQALLLLGMALISLESIKRKKEKNKKK